LQDGGTRLVEKQNDDGGWGWPLDGVSANNTIGPIGKGLAEAYKDTGDASMYAALQDVATFLQAKTNYFSPPDGYLAAELDSILGGSTNVDFVNANYYGPLAAGTYNHKGEGTLYNTQQYVQMLRDRRSSDGIPNLAAWDLGMGLVGAASAGASTIEWINGVKAEIDELDGTQDAYAVLGLAGAIHGLAFVNENYNPQDGDYASANSLSDLAVILAGEPLTSGAEDGELLQRNAYAILALNEFNRTTYLSVIQNAADYLISVQKPTGGWGGNNPPSNGENNEITGEVLWAIYASYPSSQEGGCFIATAAYGTASAAEIDVLRAFRDEVLLESTVGSQLVEFYYQTSPPVADFISENSLLRTIVRELVIDPMVSVATFTQGMWGK